MALTNYIRAQIGHTLRTGAGGSPRASPTSTCSLSRCTCRSSRRTANGAWYACRQFLMSIRGVLTWYAPFSHTRSSARPQTSPSRPTLQKSCSRPSRRRPPRRTSRRSQQAHSSCQTLSSRTRQSWKASWSPVRARVSPCRKVVHMLILLVQSTPSNAPPA